MSKAPDTRHGFDFEDEFAEATGAQKTPASGAMWHTKLDNSGDQMLWSLKSTKAGSRTISLAELEEAANAVHAPGGVGGDVIPAMAIRLGAETRDQKDVVVIELSDFLSMFAEQRTFSVTSKAEAKRTAARKTQLERAEEEAGDDVA